MERLFVSRPLLSAVTVIAIVVPGTVSLCRLPLKRTPDIAPPVEHIAAVPAGQGAIVRTPSFPAAFAPRPMPEGKSMPGFMPVGLSLPGRGGNCLPPGSPRAEECAESGPAWGRVSVGPLWRFPDLTDFYGTTMRRPYPACTPWSLGLISNRRVEVRE